MEGSRFDRLAKRLAKRHLSRRAALQAGAAGLAVTALRTATSAAQGTPAPPGTPMSELAADNGSLFVQTATTGSLTPNPAARATPAAGGTPVAAQQGAYLLTLHGHSGETIGFSDRPKRDFGEVPTARFFTGLGFLPDNPPNAALVVDTPQQQGAVVLVELLDPHYDAPSQTLTYEANLLHQYPNPKSDGLAELAAKAQYTPPASFTNVSLFIDDCPNSTETCWTVGSNGFCSNEGSITSGNCWSWATWTCNPCGSYYTLCNQAFSSCNSSCLDDIALCGTPGCCNGQCCPNPACFGTTPQSFYCPPSSYCTQACPGS